MRAWSLAAVAAGTILLTTPLASAQQERGGVNGAIDSLNRAVNPNADRDRRPADRDDRNLSGSSSDAPRRGPDYRRYSDQALRDESARVQQQERQLNRERESLTDEMDRRGIRP